MPRLLRLICLEEEGGKEGGMAADTRWKQKASEKDEQDHNQAVCLWTQSQFQQKLMLIEAKGKKMPRKLFV